VSIFEDLLAIKAFRENQAESAVRQQRAVLQEAREAREAAETLLQRLMKEGLDHETQMYRDLCARIVRLRDIEEVQQTVASLRQREADQQTQVASAIQAQENAAKQLEVTRAAHQEAARQKSKFVDLARNHALSMMQELERKEDLELEEVTRTNRDREDWEHHAAEEHAA
jgi:type III secretion protein O